MSLDCAAAEGLKPLCDCLSRQIDYQKQLKPNMEALEIRMRELIAKNDDIMRRVGCAMSQGGSASNEVTNWLREVESMKHKVSVTQRNFAEQKNCWKGRFPNCYRSRKISKKSSILIGQVDDLITKGSFENGVTEPVPLATNALPTMPIEGETAKLTQREILDCILGTEKPIIGVHGMGGVGKTTIMRNIHNNLSQQSESKHFDCFIWITVSNDTDVNKLQQTIAKQLDIDMKEDDDEDGRARKIFNALVRRKKFLLILDDMWKWFRLDEVGIPLPSKENGCKLVLTTRNKGICGQMRAHAIEVRVLSEEESWEFFKDILAVGGVIVSKDIENLAKDVAKECCNLPLAIKTVGGSMCGVDNAAVWKDALKDLKEANGEFKDIVDKVFAPLKFSYYRLGDAVLQSCFLFCSLYPEDHEITFNELIDHWICEGLIDKRGTGDDDINKGQTILDQLIKVSMLEECEYHGYKIHAGDEKCVKLHDLIRDMAINITRAEKPRSLIYAGRQLPDRPIEFPEDAERISLMDNNIKVLFGEPNCQHLLTLFLQKNPLQVISPDSYFNHMCTLRVLDLSWTRIKVLPESISNLKNLRALLLGNCEFLEEVPSLSNLEELRVLDLSFTSIRELPSGMEAMVKLQRLNLDRTKELSVFPTGIIPRLPFLEELRMYKRVVSMTTEGARIEEIVNSTQLANLEIHFTDLSSFLYHVNSGNWPMMKNFRLCVGSSVSPYHVSNSSVEINSCNLIGEDNSLLLPYNTQWLHIISCEIVSLWNVMRSMNTSELCRCRLYSCEKMEFLMADEEPLLPNLKELQMEKMPELLALCKGIPSLDSLKSLESLEVSFCHKLKYLLPARLLQQLRCLKSISVKSCGQMKEIVGEEEEMGITREDDNNAMLILSQLQSLKISRMSKLKGICSRVLICNALETISIDCCPELKNLPFSVDNLPSALKEIRVGIWDEKWWDALEWDDAQTKAHFESKMWCGGAI
eukprot:TRINITY_DN2752_c0_g1_i7.p1 TRINITY_DN2752_c0_g1~~TRINITY_DN2752_c0_g1_i7.p1  ORF type:complete len:979 (-),score=143.35 TRINITY_DN2752_c0_g1_i7:389-3325(-)